VIFRELLEAVEVLSTGGDPNVAITGITYDSRQVQPGFLFVAIKGFKSDGHDYIQESLALGAAAVVVERRVGFLPGVSWAVVPDTRQALALLSARFFGDPSARLKMIGGSTGRKAWIFEAVLGTYLLQTIYLLTVPIANEILIPEVTEILRTFITYSIILYALLYRNRRGIIH
jgi:UDP-N-acetylmuramyl pentapeptide synthase